MQDLEKTLGPGLRTDGNGRCRREACSPLATTPRLEADSRIVAVAKQNAAGEGPCSRGAFDKEELEQTHTGGNTDPTQEEKDSQTS